MTHNWKFPPLIFGTSSLGNLYQEMDDRVKLELVKACFAQTAGPVCFDSAGKYGAGLVWNRWETACVRLV